MQRVISILSLLFTFNFAMAQFGEKNAIYFSGEMNLGNYIGFDLNLNYVYKEKYTFKVGYTGNIRTPKSKPDNFSAGFNQLFTFGTSNPYDQLENYQVCFGKIFILNEKGTIRTNISIGIGYTTIREPENWDFINQNILNANYIWNYSKQNTLSLIINPKFEFPFTRIYGLTISPMLQINKFRTYYGIGIGHMFGLLRKRATNISE
jgi:hypothetical protein